MLETELFDRLHGYLTKLDTEATLLDPNRKPLDLVIRAHQRAQKPTGPYATINMIADRDLREIDCEDYRNVSLDGGSRVVMRKARAVEWLFRLDVFASNATDYLRLFRAGFRSEQVLVDLAPLVVRTIGQASRMPEMIGTNWQGRAFMDVGIAGVTLDDMLIDVIESIEIKFRGFGTHEVQRLLTIP